MEMKQLKEPIGTTDRAAAWVSRHRIYTERESNKIDRHEADMFIILFII